MNPDFSFSLQKLGVCKLRSLVVNCNAVSNKKCRKIEKSFYLISERPDTADWSFESFSESAALNLAVAIVDWYRASI